MFGNVLLHQEQLQVSARPRFWGINRRFYLKGFKYKFSCLLELLEVGGEAGAGLVYSRKEDFVVTLCVQKKKRSFGVT